MDAVSLAAKKIFLMAFIAIEVIFLAIGGFVLVSRSGDDASVEASAGTDAVALDDSTQAETQQETPNTGEQLAALYNKVLDGIANEDFSSPQLTWSNADYEAVWDYTLQDVSADGQPDLVVRKGGEDMGIVKTFIANADRSDVIRVTQGFPVGVATAGGFRGRVAGDSSGKGFFNETVFSMRERPVNRYYVFNGSDMVEGTANGASEVELAWTTSSDRGPVNALTTGKAENSSSAESNNQAVVPNPAPAANQPAAPAQVEAQPEVRSSAGGANHVSGTIKVMTAAELMAAGNAPGEASVYGVSDSTKFVMLVLDQPTEVTAKAAGAPGNDTRTASMIQLPDSMVGKDGQHVDVDLDPSQAHWPSDASLPLGEPRTLQNF